MLLHAVNPACEYFVVRNTNTSSDQHGFTPSYAHQSLLKKSHSAVLCIYDSSK